MNSILLYEDGRLWFNASATADDVRAGFGKQINQVKYLTGATGNPDEQKRKRLHHGIDCCTAVQGY